MTADPDPEEALFERICAAGRRDAAAFRVASAAARRGAPPEPKAVKRAHPERDLQKSIVGIVNRCVPGVVIAAVTNEEQGHGDADQRARFGAMRKASGVLSGHPDILVYLPGGRVLLWELKAERGTLSAAQRLVHARLAEIGHSVEVIRTVEAALAALQRAGVAMVGRLKIAAPLESLRK